MVRASESPDPANFPLLVIRKDLEIDPRPAVKDDPTVEIAGNQSGQVEKVLNPDLVI